MDRGPCRKWCRQGEGGLKDAVKGPILTLTGVGGWNKASDQLPDDGWAVTAGSWPTTASLGGWWCLQIVLTAVPRGLLLKIRTARVLSARHIVAPCCLDWQSRVSSTAETHRSGGTCSGEGGEGGRLITRFRSPFPRTLPPSGGR